VFHSAPFVADVGIEPTRVSDGEVDASVDLAPRHLQHTGVVHAGVLTTLADHTSGAAAYTLAPAGAAVVTADMHVALLRAAIGERLECTARVVKPGRQMMFTEAEVYCIRAGARQLVAKFSATMAVVEAR
jgi:uncharacterized protein (TIGR00369 family)